LRIPTFLLVLLLAQIGWKGDQKFPLPRSVTEGIVDSMAAEYYEAELVCYPALATFKGIPGYDDKLATYSQRSVFGLLTRIRNLDRSLATLDEDSLSMGKWIEYKALLADMASQRFLLEDLEVWRSRPTLYVDACVDGIASLYLLSNRAPDSDLSPRLRMIPDVVKYARRNLTKPSALHCRVASRRLEALIAMLRTLPQGAPARTDPGLLQESIAALEGFGAFLDSLSLSADTEFALGYDDFLILSDTRNMISDVPEAVRTYAWRVLDDVNAELKQYPPASSPAGAGGMGRIDVETLKAELDSAWVFLERTDLVSLPRSPGGSGPQMMFVEMPDVARRLLGDMLCIEPGAGAEPGYLASLYVAPGIAEPGATAGGIVLSEAFPGRYMQTVAATASSSLIRRMHTDIFATNGWALYSQELAAREGFGGTRAIRDALERKRFYAAGTIAAVNLLLGEFSIEAAADFMAKETGVSEAYARDLAVQYALEPEHPISYIIGDRQIRQIRDEVSRILGENFSLKSFHDSLLASGRLPLYLLRNNVVSALVGRR